MEACQSSRIYEPTSPPHFLQRWKSQLPACCGTHHPHGFASGAQLKPSKQDNSASISLCADMGEQTQWGTKQGLLLPATHWSHLSQYRLSCVLGASTTQMSPGSSQLLLWQCHQSTWQVSFPWAYSSHQRFCTGQSFAPYSTIATELPGWQLMPWEPWGEWTFP